MKNHILLVISIMIFSVEAKKQTSPTEHWHKQYGVHQLSSADKTLLADGFYYLLKTQGDDKKAPTIMTNIYSEFHNPNARKAFLNVYEKSALASHRSNAHKETWTSTLLPYYAEVLGTLKDNELKIAVGPDFGKNLPRTFFELDRALNPQPSPIITVFEISMPGFSLQSVLVQ